MRRAPTTSRRRRSSGGFTLVELLLGIILSGIFGIALYAFFLSGLKTASSSEQQTIAQTDGRNLVDRLGRELRQAVSPDGGTTPQIASLSPSSIVFYADFNRTPGNPVPRPKRVRYQIIGTDLVRDSAAPVGATPPYTYGAYTDAETVVRGVSSATALFQASNSDGNPLATTLNAPATFDIARVTVDLVIGYREGDGTSTLEITTDVSPRNPRT